MARTPKRVASATGNDQSQAVQTGSAASTPSDTATGSSGETSDSEGDTSEAQGNSSPPADDSAETSVPAPVAETPVDTSSEPTTSPEPEPAPDVATVSDASAPVDEIIEVRVLVAYDDHLPNDVIVMDRAEAETRLEQVDADPIAVAYAKSLVA